MTLYCTLKERTLKDVRRIRDAVFEISGITITGTVVHAGFNNLFHP